MRKLSLDEKWVEFTVQELNIRNICYWPDFDQTLRWHFSRQHLSLQHLSISGISLLLLPRFWTKVPGTIHNRCQSSWYLSRQHLPISGISQPKPNLIFWIKIFIGPKFCWPKFFWTQNFCRPKIFVDPKFLWIQIFLNSKFYGPKILCSQNFLNLNFLDLTFFYPNFFEPHFFYLILTWMQQKHKKK